MANYDLYYSFPSKSVAIAVSKVIFSNSSRIMAATTELPEYTLGRFSPSAGLIRQVKVSESELSSYPVSSPTPLNQPYSVA